LLPEWTPFVQSGQACHYRCTCPAFLRSPWKWDAPIEGFKAVWVLSFDVDQVFGAGLYVFGGYRNVEQPIEASQAPHVSASMFLAWGIPSRTVFLHLNQGLFLLSVSQSSLVFLYFQGIFYVLRFRDLSSFFPPGGISSFLPLFQESFFFRSFKYIATFFTSGSTNGNNLTLCRDLRWAVGCLQNRVRSLANHARWLCVPVNKRSDPCVSLLPSSLSESVDFPDA
jgi:hypothetical protein